MQRLMLVPQCMQTPLRTNDLLNATKYVSTPDDNAALQRAFPGLLAASQPTSAQAVGASGMPADVDTDTAAAPEGGFLAGDAYYSAKDQLIMDEQVLLRVLRFSISIEHPHKYLLNMCRLLGCSQPLAHLATCLVSVPALLQAPGKCRAVCQSAVLQALQLFFRMAHVEQAWQWFTELFQQASTRAQVNDSLGRTQLCVSHSAAEVAAGALHLASLLLGVARDMPFRGQACWWDALGFSLVTVEEVGHALFDALLRQQQP